MGLEAEQEVGSVMKDVRELRREREGRGLWKRENRLEK